MYFGSYQISTVEFCKNGWEVLVEKPHHRSLIGFLMHLCFMLFMGTVSLKLLAFNRSRNNKHSIFNPSHPDSGFLKKLTWIFIFTLLCGTSKNLKKVVNAFIKPFEVPWRSVKIKIWVNFLFSIFFEWLETVKVKLKAIYMWTFLSYFSPSNDMYKTQNEETKKASLMVNFLLNYFWNIIIIVSFLDFAILPFVQ